MYDHIRQIIETRILKDGGSSRSISFPVFLEGRQFKQPTGSHWSVLFIADGNNVRDQFSTDLSIGSRVSGSIRFKFYVPHGEGSRLARKMADELNGFLNYSSGSESIAGIEGDLFIKNGSLSMVSDDDDGYMSYNLDYIFDYYT